MRWGTAWVNRMDTLSFLYGLIGGMAAVIAADFFFYKWGKNAASDVAPPSAIVHSNPELENQLFSAKQEIETLKTELESLKTSPSEKSSDSADEPSWPDQRLIVAQLEARLQELESNPPEPETSNDEREAEHEQALEKLRQEVATATSEAQDSRAELTQAKEELQRARAELVRVVTGGQPSNIARSVDHEEVIAAKDAAINTLKKKVEELSAAQHPAMDFAAKIEEREAQIRALEDRVAELLQQAQTPIESLSTESVPSGNVAVEPGPSAEEMMILKMQLGALQEELQKREARIAEYETRETESTVSGDASPVLHSKIADLEDELEAKNRELSGLKQKLADAHESSNAGGSRKLAELDSELVTLRSQLNTRENEISKLKRDLQDLQRFYENEDTVAINLAAASDSTETIPSVVVSAPEPVLTTAPSGSTGVAQQAMTLAQQLAGGSKPAASASTATAPPGFTRAGRDPLQSIEGIGPVYQAKLWEAGVHRFSDLAGLTAQQVVEIIQPKEWQHIDADVWIEEAKRIAAEG